MQVFARKVFRLKFILDAILPFRIFVTIHDEPIDFLVANNILLHVLTNAFVVDRSFLLDALRAVDIR